MKNLLIALVQATPNGPQVTQTGQIETSLGGPDSNFIVRFDQPKAHRRVIPAAGLQAYSLFETQAEFIDFMGAITPKPQASTELPIEPPQVEALEETQDALRR